MAAPKGNKFWLARTTHGRSCAFTPETLWAGCMEYFEWVHENPLLEDKLFAYQGYVTRETVGKMRAMTIIGLCNFLGISKDCWRQYSERQDFVAVTTGAEEIIKQQKFEGAAAELLNANIIARDLGLVDKKDVTVDGKLDTGETDPMKTAALIAAVIAKARKA